MNKLLKLFAGVLVFSLHLQCSKSKDGANLPAPSALAKSNALEVFQTADTVDLEVWYEEGAEPYTKVSLTDDAYWDILESNLNAILQYRTQAPRVQVPKTLSAMYSLGSSGKDNWTSEDLLALAAANVKTSPASGTARYQIYFLNGYFNKGEGSNKGILGVHIGDSRVLALFKPVIAGTSSSGPLDRVAQYVEQSTLVHEMGHAMGFVNNGVSMVAPHQDSEHGAHTTNKDCVMYWANEGASDLTAFILKYIGTSKPLLWGPEVLADAKAISR